MQRNKSSDSNNCDEYNNQPVVMALASPWSEDAAVTADAASNRRRTDKHFDRKHGMAQRVVTFHGKQQEQELSLHCNWLHDSAAL